MDPKIRKLIEICRFEDDPGWDRLGQLFNGVEWPDMRKVLENRDALIAAWIEEKDAKLSDITDDLTDSVEEIGDRGIKTKEPLMIWGLQIPKFGIHFGGSKVYLGANVFLSQTVIHAPTYIDDGAVVEFTNIQSPSRHTYIGPNAKLSGVAKVRGCFLSGGPIKETGRERTHMSARSLNNCIVGAYVGTSTGTEVKNHPETGQRVVMVDPEDVETRYRVWQSEQIWGETRGVEMKYPIFLGVEAEVGDCCSLHGGSVIGADTVVPGGSRIEGLAYLSGSGRTVYECARPNTLGMVTNLTQLE